MDEEGKKMLVEAMKEALNERATLGRSDFYYDPDDDEWILEYTVDDKNLIWRLESIQS